LRKLNEGLATLRAEKDASNDLKVTNVSTSASLAEQRMEGGEEDDPSLAEACRNVNFSITLLRNVLHIASDVASGEKHLT